MRLRKHLASEAEARALIRALYVSSADVQTDDALGILTICIHRMASPAHGHAIALLLAVLTATKFRHQETGHRFLYQLV